MFAREAGDSSGVLAPPSGGWREKLGGKGREEMVGPTHRAAVSAQRKLSTSYPRWEERPP